MGLNQISSTKIGLAALQLINLDFPRSLPCYCTFLGVWFRGRVGCVYKLKDLGQKVQQKSSKSRPQKSHFPLLNCKSLSNYIYAG